MEEFGRFELQRLGYFTLTHPDGIIT